MDLEKAYDRVDREALWQLLGVYGVEGGLLAAIKAFYKESEFTKNNPSTVKDFSRLV